MQPIIFFFSKALLLFFCLTDCNYFFIFIHNQFLYIRIFLDTDKTSPISAITTRIEVPP